MAAPMSDLTPTASPRHFFGAELRFYRLRAGMSQHALAPRVLRSPTMLGKVEKAIRYPTLDLAERCDLVLDTATEGGAAGLYERLGWSQVGEIPDFALKPHGGLVLYRGFVYNHHADWTDMKADRAKAGYDNFSKLDGTFDDNVVIQIKNGPIDFQIVGDTRSEPRGATAHVSNPQGPGAAGLPCGGARRSLS